jgi:hypothetical protein
VFRAAGHRPCSPDLTQLWQRRDRAEASKVLDSGAVCTGWQRKNRDVEQSARQDDAHRRASASCPGYPRALRWIAAVLLFALTALTSQAAPDATQPSLGDVEAAYLYNFGKFVRWPQSAERGTMLICVAGKDPFAQTVGRLVTGERIDDRPLEVRSLERPEGVHGCSILFVGTGERGRLDGFLAAADGKQILTVGDSPDFLTHGGIIQFIFQEDHVRFSVNLNAASRNGLTLSSELLKVAISVVGGPGHGGVR